MKWRTLVERPTIKLRDSKDVCDGLAISVAKLEHLLADTPNGKDMP
jgi:hypothetical protein